MWKELERIKQMTITLLSVIPIVMPTPIITAQANCLLLMTNKEAKKYTIQTIDNAQFILIRPPP